jgi:tetratricopeptide (TPR) repeat protein
VSPQERRQAREERILNPATTPAKAALLLREQYGDRPLEPSIALAIVARGDLARARAVAGAALALEPGPMALSLAADVALIEGRPDEAEGHATRALRLSDEPELHLRLAIARADQGRIADGIEVLDRVLVENPGFEELQLARGELLERLAGLDVKEDADRRALERFRDRGSLLALQDAVASFSRSSPDREERFAAGLAHWIEAGAVSTDELRDWTERVAADPRAREASLIRLIGEWSWLAAPGDDEQCLLEAFGADPATPADLARRADDLLGLALWGLWEVGRPSGSPGVQLTELLSGARVYAEMPPELLEGVPRWSVLIGYVAPVEGVLRAGSGFFTARPMEGREIAHELLDSLLEELPEVDSDPAASELLEWADRTHDDLDLLRLPGEAAMPSSESFAVYQAMTRSLVPELVRALREIQGTAPEREVPTVLRVELEVADPAAAVEALSRLPDFESDEDGDLLWEPEGADVDGPQGTVAAEDDGLVAHLDSVDELQELLGLLERLGQPATVRSSETVPLDLVDLEPDLGLEDLDLDLDDEDEEVDGDEEDGEVDPDSPVPVPDLDPAGMQRWLRGWADLPQPILDGRTPLDVAPLYPDRVEVLVRCLEYELDARGIATEETERLRERLF